MEGRTGQVRDGGEKGSTRKAGRPATVIQTVPFTCPSTKVVIHTTKPEFVEVAAYINLMMEQFPNADQITDPEEQAMMQAVISGKLLDYFSRTCVRLTREQFIEGGKVVVAEYKKVGVKQKPSAKQLIRAIVLLAYCPTADDKRAFLAHMSQLSGLVRFMTPADQEATAKVLNG